MEDEDIIEMYFSRDSRAISETETKYGKYCYQVAYNILRVHEDSEECVNDTYMRTWNSIPPTRPSCFKLFLAKITRNLSLDRYRRKKAQKRGSGEVGNEAEYRDEILGEMNEMKDAGFSPDSMAGEFSSVEDEVLAGELREIINSFLSELTSRDRVAFLMRYFWGKKTDEIAAKIGVKEENARKILFRTRQKLKVRLEKEGYSL